MEKSSKYNNYTKEELADELETLKKKKYGLVWDKKNSQEELDAFVNWENVPENFIPKQFPVLKENKNKEIKTDKTKPVNLLIEGDNYHSLAVLNFTHRDKVDVIYIDPPYNTGNEGFVYNDKIVDREDPYRHSKWLSFMDKRLRLSHQLLKDTGTIFISIDDNEQAQLKLLCDEIFDEENFIGMFKWNRVAKAPSLSNSIRTKYEYILAYYNETRIELFGKSSYNTQGPLWHLPNKRTPLNFPAGSFKIKQTFKKGDYGGSYKVELLDDIIEDGGYNKNDVRIVAHSAWGQRKIDQYIKDGFTFEIKKTPATVYTTLNSEGNFIAPSDLITKEECGVETNTDASGALKAMGIPFDSPKPVSLIKYLINAATHDNKSAIILDFFAGSGTTGQAVLELNNGDKGSRKFILCTNNENNICTDVCYPRIEKITNGYKNTRNEKIVGLGGNLKYFKTDFVGSDPNDKNKRDLVKQSTEMICIKEDIFDLKIDSGFDFKIYQKGERFLGVVFDIASLENFKKAAEKCNGNFSVYCFSYNETTPEKEFKNLNNEYTFKPIPAVILKVYLEIFKK